METDFLIATMLNLGVNLIYTMIALFIGILALQIIDKKLLSNIDIEAEMKNGNLAVAIFASTIMIFVALIVTFGFRG
ncbi:MAG: DUF350 domain-containing protein [Gammaproteobacteria bacterium]|nr:DUF350 domain-containing protein [Gammaproteobacteria bacterium]